MSPCCKRKGPRVTISLLVGCIALMGCPGGDSAREMDAATSMSAPLSHCADDPRALTYVPGLEQTGTEGLIHFTLLKSDPAPLIKGTNTWQIGLADESGHSIKDAEITTTPYMPDHGHGTSIVPRATAQDGGYEITPLYLYMGGIWEMTISAKTEAVEDSAVFTFCIPD